VHVAKSNLLVAFFVCLTYFKTIAVFIPSVTLIFLLLLTRLQFIDT